jgi:hypothetical protein
MLMNVTAEEYVHLTWIGALLMVARFLITSSRLPSVRINHRDISISTSQVKGGLALFLNRARNTHKCRPSFRQ